MTLKPAVFIDRDGTISEEVGYINHQSRLELLPRSAAAIKKLNEAGIPAVLVTNQAGVARGYFPEERVLEVNGRLVALLQESGARLDGVYYCPHHPTSGEPPYRQDCNCRKPKPGMIEAASRDIGLDPALSYAIGDKFTDVELAHRVGGKGILVLTGYGRGLWEYEKDAAPSAPDYVAEDLEDAVDWILEDMKNK